MDFEPLLRWLRAAFLENLGLKAMAFAFAVGFFGYVHAQENVQQRTIPVSVISLPPEHGTHQLMSPIPPAIHVTLRGSRRAMTDLVQDGIPPVEIDLREDYPLQVTFDREMFLLPHQLEVMVVDPPSIKFDWEEVITRQIPIQSSITGKLAEGFIIKGEPEIEPPRITVRGPRSSVEVMQFARLEPYNVTGLTAGKFPRRIAIDQPPPRVEYLGRPAATVHVEVKRRESEKLFSDLKVEVIGPTGADVRTDFVDVTVVGPPDAVRALKPEQIVPTIDLVKSNVWNEKMTGPGSATVEIKVELNNVKVEVQPPRTTVRW
jgi:YbbR domain-containing protein